MWWQIVGGIALGLGIVVIVGWLMLAYARQPSTTWPFK